MIVLQDDIKLKYKSSKKKSKYRIGFTCIATTCPVKYGYMVTFTETQLTPLLIDIYDNK